MPTLLLALLAAATSLASAQLSFPKSELGFIYKDGRPCADVKLAAYVDLTCPDSQASFGTLLQVAGNFTPFELQLKLYLFSLPYHRNSHLISKATRFLSSYFQSIKSNATAYDWIQLVYDNIDSLTTTATLNKTEGDVVNFLTALAQKLAPVTADAFRKGVYDSSIDSDTRLEWKYGCTRGVYGTPFFTINDVFTTGDAAGWTPQYWVQLIKSLLPANSITKQAC
ncbi:uncharacterized protein LOC131928095 [Physella acuta]|uniref:uncharacterized protein LOC131928095 n=1 Tax=Physella acuta TaxID=109671 RepID=UPI0027DB1ADF|nr:uncharacterized protein LOC131928095 [Physella acuta]